MKVDLTQITSPGGATGKAPDDWMARANDLVTNFKGLMVMAGKTEPPITPATQAGQETGNQAAGQTSEIAQLMQIAIAYGLGDTPVGELLTKLAPYTIKQVMGVFQNANRPKQ